MEKESYKQILEKVLLSQCSDEKINLDKQTIFEIIPELKECDGFEQKK